MTGLKALYVGAWQGGGVQGEPSGFSEKEEVHRGAKGY